MIDNIIMKSEKRKIAIIAGEVSGDKIGSDLVSEIASVYDIDLCGVGGEELARHGLKSLFPYEELSIIGFWDIIKNIFTLRKRVNSTAKSIVVYKPELLILIDSPEFTHRVAKKVKKVMPNITIINYISPTIWFWRQGRGRKMNEYITHVLSIYPFEPALYKKLNGPPCTYVGNPLFENILKYKLNRKKIENKNKTIVFMPGSRKSEIEKLLPPCIAAFREIKKLGYEFNIEIPTFDHFIDFIKEKFVNTGINYSIFSSENKKINSFWHSDFAITASGSATLELAACRLPMIVIYKLTIVNSLIASAILKINNLKNVSFSLPNLISQKKIIPELLQSDCNSKKITAELIKMFNDRNAINDQLSVFENIHGIMRVKVRPEKAAADIIRGYL